mmetsp:Transcript_11058/g.33007  ORF Transcript_11058/g.33007 Transcript_11058/m.33007 type:complete len:317 (-) Transcript_11058:70-1020(-)
MGDDAPPPYEYKPQEATLVPVPLNGLEPLKQLASITVNQEKELAEAALNAVNIDYEGANKYRVRDPGGRPVYHIVEESSCCQRQCCNPNHSMTLHVVDNNGVEVMNMRRPWNWNCCCLECGNCCGLSKMDVFLGADGDDDERRLGRVRMPCLGGGFTPKFNIEDRNGDVKAVVKGPCCCVSDLCGAKFEVEAPGGREIGKVKKIGIKSGGDVAAEVGTDADNFVISFPQDLNIEYKALMMGSLLILDYTFFEDEGAFEFDPFSCSCKFKCCDCFCCGCIVPCSCNCPAKKPEDGKGAPPAAEATPAPVAHAIRRGD